MLRKYFIFAEKSAMQQMELLKIKVCELEAFCESERFVRFLVKPISPLRTRSYLHNPRVRANDTILYIYVVDDKVIAFRTLLPDDVQTQGESLHFAWCSGVWVNPEYRGQKLSLSLLNEVYNDWGNRLMFTNYADISQYCYMQTQRFQLLVKRSGIRFYFYPNFNRLYRQRKNYSWLKFFLPLLTFGVKALSFIKSMLIYRQPTVQTIETESVDDDCAAFLDRYPDTLFNRKTAELRWLMQYRWVTAQTDEKQSYPFSWTGIRQKMRVVKVFENSDMQGFFIYAVTNGKMKILYWFFDKDVLPTLSALVSCIARKEKIEYLTVLDTSMAALFRKRITGAGLQKAFSSHIYSAINIPEAAHLQAYDGDGDNSFT